jgi:ligand-binding SRPBCC domain-containing protein
MGIGSKLLQQPHRFVDEQVIGPYRYWVHEHRFAERASGTQCTDHAEYSVLGGSLVNKLFMARDVKRIFAYRSVRLQEIFQNVPTEECGKITGTSGASGLIGWQRGVRCSKMT